MKLLFKNCLAEALGTFALVFCGTGAITINEITGGAVTHTGVAISFGLIVMAMIYTLGDVSGAHLNPAVTFAFIIVKEFPLRYFLPYIASQTVGALAASGSLKLLFPTSHYLGTTLPFDTKMQSFLLEIILSFILVFVILRVAKGSKEQGLFAGIAIGSVVMLEAMFAGPITGASMNPARSFAPALVSGYTEHLWIYLLAPFIGAYIATVIYQFFRK